MPILPLALPSGRSVGRQPHAGVARCINCYAEQASEQKSDMQIWAVPGLDGVATLDGTGGARALFEVDGVALGIFGRTLYQIEPGGTALTIGGIPSDGFVGMARNQRGTGTQTAIVSDGLSYIFSSGSLTRITDPDLPPSIDVCCINRSFIFATADGRMARSEIDDGFSIDGLDVTVAEAVPDGLYRVLDRGGDLIALGPRSMEVWTDAGGEAFGFARTHVVRIGAIGARCVTKASLITGSAVTDTVVWCASDHDGKFAGVVMLDGYTPRKISDLDIDRRIEAVADKSRIVASSYVSRGHGFVTLRLDDTTLGFDTTTGRWHERQSLDEHAAMTAWRVSLMTVLDGRTLAADAEIPRLYWVDEDAADEDGDDLVVIARTPVAHAFPGRIELNQLYLDVIPGVGTIAGGDEDTAPTITLRFSRDGETWSASRARSLGRQGDRWRRVSWSALGTFDAVSFEFACSAAVARGLLQAKWDGTVLGP